MAEDKGYKPTKRRLKEANREGKLVRSQNLTFAISLTCGICTTISLVSHNWVRFQMLLEYSARSGFHDPYRAISEWLSLGISILIPVLLAAGLGAVITEQRCARGNWVGIRFKGINPLQGLSKISALLPSIAGMTIKLSAAAFNGSFLLYRLSQLLSGVATIPLRDFEVLVRDELLFALLSLCAVALVIGTTEYFWRRRNFFRELSMSRDEVMRENREEEGDPMIRAMRRSLHEALLRQDLIKRIRRSKVIVVERRIG